MRKTSIWRKATQPSLSILTSLSCMSLSARVPTTLAPLIATTSSGHLTMDALATQNASSASTRPLCAESRTASALMARNTRQSRGLSHAPVMKWTSNVILAIQDLKARDPVLSLARNCLRTKRIAVARRSGPSSAQSLATMRFLRAIARSQATSARVASTWPPTNTSAVRRATSDHTSLSVDSLCSPLSALCYTTDGPSLKLSLFYCLSLTLAT